LPSEWLFPSILEQASFSTKLQFFKPVLGGNDEVVEAPLDSIPRLPLYGSRAQLCSEAKAITAMAHLLARLLYRSLVMLRHFGSSNVRL
jgi:hypothetical protein